MVILNQLLPKRFMDKIRIEGECWLWQGAPDKDGYMSTKINKKRMRVHRYSWSFFNGPIPEGAFILHKCDVPACINPEHLFAGTHTENMKDMYEKGRENPPKGEECHFSKLSEQEVIEIRSLYTPIGRNRLSQKEIALKYNVHQSTISYLVNNKIWKCLLTDVSGH